MPKKRKKVKELLIGRDPTMGIPAWKSGTIKTRKDRLKNRNDKYARQEKAEQTSKGGSP